MIPKIIHYAWFGSSLPDGIAARVEKWQQILPDWEFKFWNEDNYDLSSFKFSTKMYQDGKLGYVTDELRYDVLYRYGGFYLDTDMVIEKTLNDFLDKKMVWGFLYDNSLATGIIGAEPGQELFKKILKVYAGNEYDDIHECLYKMTSNPIATRIFIKEYENFKIDGTYQELQPGFIILPKYYFTYKEKNNKDKSYAEHLFDNSWGDRNKGLYGWIKYLFKRFSPYLWARISAKRGMKSARMDGVYKK